MKIRFTISRKLSLGFGVLLVAVLSTSTLTYQTLDDQLQINRLITEVYTPSKSSLNDLFFLITNSKMLIKNWVFIERHNDTPDKIKLREIHEAGYPSLLENLNSKKIRWRQSEQKLFEELVEMIDTLIVEHQSIMEQLNSFDSYDNMVIFLPALLKVEENGEIVLLTDRILDKLGYLIAVQTAIESEANSRMKSLFANFQQLIVVFGIILVIFIIIIGIMTSRALVVPINYIKGIISEMSVGVLPDGKIQGRNDEIGEMAEALNNHISGLKRISSFALEIGKENYQTEFNPLGDRDALGNSLLLMRDSLQKAAKEEEQRKLIDSQRTWATAGIAKFGEILRTNNDNLEDLANIIITELVNYLDANQGGLFIINDENEREAYLELLAHYAYDRKKFTEKRIEIGVTLVGQCVKEKETVFLSDIPHNYIHITSGLGKDAPRNLIIVPLLIDQDVYGAVEIASFKTIEPYKIEFVEKIGESIASTIARVKINIKTSRLLSESQEKSQRLAQQEEEMRKQIELFKREQEDRRKRDLEALEMQRNDYETRISQITSKFDLQQKEMAQQQTLVQNNYNAVNNAVGILEYSMDGNVLSANSRYLRMTEMPMDAVLGKHHSHFMSESDINTLEYQSLWPELVKGKIQISERHFVFEEHGKWFIETLTPVKDIEGKYYKVIAMLGDITNLRLREQDFQRRIDSLRLEIERIKR